jgi:hypothetical protein
MYSRLSDLRITGAHVKMLMTNDKVEERRNFMTFVRESQRKTKVADYLRKLIYVQDNQNVSVHLMITLQKTRKNILNSFNHIPR